MTITARTPRNLSGNLKPCCVHMVRGCIEGKDEHFMKQVALFPGLHPTSCHLQAGKMGEPGTLYHVSDVGIEQL